jgi:hypothetical protein
MSYTSRPLKSRHFPVPRRPLYIHTMGSHYNSCKILLLVFFFNEIEDLNYIRTEWRCFLAFNETRWEEEEWGREQRWIDGVSFKKSAKK